MREWGSGGGTRRDFMIGCPLAAAVVFRLTGGFPLILLFGLFSIMTSGLVESLSRFGFLLSGLLLGCLLLTRVGRQDALLLGESLGVGDVSRAWLVWSSAAQTALADAYRFSGGLAPSQGLVLGRGMARFRLVRLGGHKVRKVRGNAADVHDAADVFLYRDSSIAPLHDMRRRFKAVMGVLDAMIRYGVSLARSFELTAQWDRILAAGPLYTITLDDLSMVRGMGIGDFHQVVSDVHRRLRYFIYAVVVHRRDEAIRRWCNWLWEDPFGTPKQVA